ncbi:MAG: hypothetical protein SGJ27_29075 [Candidatus Melainabacteria bacterium]|nr:hypothetical protein [Candidatus Melainabacteria bacterium]
MDLLFGFFNFIGTLIAGGFTLVLAVCSGGWICGFIGNLVTFAYTDKESITPGTTIGVVGFALWAIYCLFTAASIGAAFLAVLGLIAVACVVLFFAFFVFAPR